jgi:general secretion pathway protein M
MRMVESLVDFWQARSQRERAILGAGTTALLVALLYAFLWDPGMAARNKLSASLPLLRAQVEDMRAQQRALAVLREHGGATAQRPDIKPLLEASLARSALAGALARVEALSADRARIRADSIEFDAWLGWVEALQREFGVQVEACRITSLGAGRVRVEARFVSGGAR